MRRKYSWPVLVICSVFLISLALLGEGRLWGQKADIAVAAAGGYESYVFRLTLQGQPMDDYSECLGLGSSNTIEEAINVTDTGVVFTEKTPGTLQRYDITLRRTGPSDAKVWQWRRAMEDLHLDAAIRDGSILMLRAGSLEPVAEWAFRNGWAARLSFDGSMEELVIVHEGLERPGEASIGPPIRR